MFLTRLQRFGFALAVASAALAAAGLIYGDVSSSKQFLRFIAHDYRRYHDGAAMVFYGTWGCLAGLFIWIAYPSTLGQVVRWVLHGKEKQ